MADRVRAVVFDLWGTLMTERREGFPRRAALRYAGVAPLLARLGIDAGEQRFTRALLASNAAIGRMQNAGRDVSAEERARHVLYQLAPGEADRAAGELVAAFVEACSGAIISTPPVLLDGAEDALRAVRARGLSVGLLSNTGVSSGRHLRGVLEGQGLLEAFDALIFSDEHAMAKPNRGLFDLALEALGVDAREAVFVGDTPRFDIGPPRSYGWWVVQVGARDDGDPPAHARVAGVAQVLPALEAMGLIEG